MTPDPAGPPPFQSGSIARPGLPATEAISGPLPDLLKTSYDWNECWLNEGLPRCILLYLHASLAAFRDIERLAVAWPGSRVRALALAHTAPAQGLPVALFLRAIELSMLWPAGIAQAADAW